MVGEGEEGGVNTGEKRAPWRGTLLRWHAPPSLFRPLHYSHSFPRRWTHLDGTYGFTPYPVVEFGRQNAQDFGRATSKDFHSSAPGCDQLLASGLAGRTTSTLLPL